MSIHERIARTRENARAQLMAERGPDGHWRGELSSSALSTATACAAMALGEIPADQSQVQAGLSWLANHQNEDGGFGDTTRSPSNLSTTALSWMALGFGGQHVHSTAHQRAAEWLRQRLGKLDPASLAAGLREVYAQDQTFAIPILVACTVGGAFEASDKPWKHIARLPYELAAFPRRWFKWLGLSVVSYALPALIAIGQAIEHNRPSLNPIMRVVRRLTRNSTLATLQRIQPAGGGFLEATPLTSFVVLSLVACGRAEHAVAREGLDFLRRSMREDGSWPIDTDLATWLSTLAVNALATDGQLHEHLGSAAQESLGKWISKQQHTQEHPYTGAAPGGWAWTDLPGGVPDADDTAGALLASLALEACDSEQATAAALWLRNLQNKDGGMPTFCKGWGKLPFDASCADLTAHALRAWHAWTQSALARDGETIHIRTATQRAQQHLIKTQSPEGSWIPLWFGNQHSESKTNPTYGTSRVLRACCVPGTPAWERSLIRGLRWLLSAQNEDGGFGGDLGLPSSIEESALALEALADCARHDILPSSELLFPIRRVAGYLVEATEEGASFPTEPIGLYFAQLWYSERLYPLIFTVSALELCAPLLDEGATRP